MLYFGGSSQVDVLIVVSTTCIPDLLGLAMFLDYIDALYR
jgi:hypothetical protein